MNEIQFMIRDNKKDGWKEEYDPTSLDLIDENIRDLFEKHSPNERGSYHLVIKVNGGYGKNPETGATTQIHWKGPLNKITRFIPVWGK